MKQIYTIFRTTWEDPENIFTFKTRWNLLSLDSLLTTVLHYFACLMRHVLLSSVPLCPYTCYLLCQQFFLLPHLSSFHWFSLTNPFHYDIQCSAVFCISVFPLGLSYVIALHSLTRRNWLNKTIKGVKIWCFWYVHFICFNLTL